MEMNRIATDVNNAQVDRYQINLEDNALPKSPKDHNVVAIRSTMLMVNVNHAHQVLQMTQLSQLVSNHEFAILQIHTKTHATIALPAQMDNRSMPVEMVVILLDKDHHADVINITLKMDFHAFSAQLVKDQVPLMETEAANQSQHAKDLTNT
jgi:hypothetical protein